jgi:hypothetical protein
MKILQRAIVLPLSCLALLVVAGLPGVVRADSDPKPDPDFGQIEYYGSHGPGDEYYKGKLWT